MSNFLFELGTEEIPAPMIEPALAQLEEALGQLLQENGVQAESLTRYSSSRRLTVLARGLPDFQPQRQETVLGPPSSVGLDDDGTPTRAALGFAGRHNVAPDQLEVFETPKGSYVGCRITHPARPLPEILQEGLGAVIAGIAWPKSMYWSQSRFRFIRPIRWLVTLWNREVLAFEFEGVEAGRETRGHRFLSRGSVSIEDPDDYVSKLRDAFVLVDGSERQEKIRREIDERTPPGLEVLPDDGLLKMTSYLNEFPTVMQGTFDEEFLSLPREILVTVMRHHQKYFALQDDEGEIQGFFLTVLNTHDQAAAQIRLGHERVLRARLQDAAFFWDNDRKQTLESRVETLSRVTFQQQLGSYKDKTERVRAVCRQLSGDASLDQAATLCKADLTTETVFEISELQGVMGGLYAQAEGYPEEVWKAIYEHYLPIASEDRCPASTGGAILSIADRIDTIAGCFSVGIRPTSSSDPFALRRQAQGIVRILHRNNLDFSLDGLVEAGFRQFDESPAEVRDEVKSFLLRRVRHLLAAQRGMDYDVVNAVLEVPVTTVPDVVGRAEALQKVRRDEDFVALAVADRRIQNILEGQQILEADVDPALFEEPSESGLWDAFSRIRPDIEERLARRDYEQALRAMASLRGVVDRFFDEVMVLVEDETLRNNRVALLSKLAETFRRVADISLVVRSDGP